MTRCQLVLWLRSGLTATKDGHYPAHCAFHSGRKEDHTRLSSYRAVLVDLLFVDVEQCTGWEGLTRVERYTALRKGERR